ncbi:cytosine deaminase-like metal-dependent hydrolase [Desulfocapsa sulfexigens DSM 10523]|uniref:Cytosine deaminase-like metal-dependent hydrolase n=1 Tax=Desulfocapsa sulfexigens (strain DSM 10523 / SB164P1) TaxID=1167006 RepID=M1P3W3_DESSD|nr:amidohydrolase [Desulfocapsa sulfexigens]AGF78173.1 cytosine deaminase-like metal-dependent hydrolase [Desulfocapsa sulfexigens DSM 10523]
MPNTSILISNVTLFTDPDTPLKENQWLLCKDELIHSSGSMESMPEIPDTTLIEGTGKLLMPGLINAHNHCAMTLFRGLADDLELGEWLNDHIFPAEAAHVNPEMVYWCTKLAAAEMILSGTTTVADGYFYEDQAARALLESGMRAIPAQGIVDFPAPGVVDPKTNIDTVNIFLTDWKDRDDRITPGVFAHSPYTCSPKTLQSAKALATEHQVPFFIHIAESRDEMGNIMDPQGTSPIRHLAALDLLDKNTVLIHGIWLDEDDRKIIQQSGAGVVVCPQSHFKLASGIAATSTMDTMGIPIGLGTDGSASNNGLDLFREMDTLAKSQKLRTLDATAMPARKALAAATVNNARILGLTDVGRIKPGYKADITLLNLAEPHLQPFYSADSLVYSGNGADIETVIINGTIVLKERKFLSFDLNECMTEVRNLATVLGSL